MNSLKKNTGRPFRFPFDIDRRVFLLLAALFFILSIKRINTAIFPRLTTTTIEKKINKDFNQQFAEFKKIVQNLTKEDINFKSAHTERFEKLNDKSWSYSLYKNDSLIFWSKSISRPDKLNNIQSDSLYTYENKNEVGLIIKKNKIIDNESLEILGKFPLYVHYNIENDFFKSYFTFLTSSGNEQEDFGYTLKPLAITSAGKDIVKIEEVPRFYFEEKTSFLDITDRNFWRFFLAAIPFIMFGVSIHTYFKVSVKDNPPLYFSLLLLTVFVLRGLCYFWNFPDNFSEFSLFNPSLYAAGGLNTSLGDVFINASLLFWILFFYIMNVQNKVISLKVPLFKILFITICSLLLFGFAYLSIFNIHSLINDGHLNFDTTNYEHITSDTIIGLGTLLLTFMNFVLGIIIYNRYFERYFKNNVTKFFVPLAGIILAYLLVDDKFLIALIISCIWTSMTLLFLSIKFLSTKFDFNSYKLIYWLIYLSASCVFIIYYFDAEKESALRQNFAESLIHFENNNTELGLIELGQQLKNDSTIPKLNSKNEVVAYLNRKYIVQYDLDYTAEVFVFHPILDSSTARNEIQYSSQNTRVIHNASPAIYLNEEVGEEKYLFSLLLDEYQIIVKLSPSYGLNGNRNATLTQDFELSKKQNTKKYSIGYYYNDQLMKQSGIDDFPAKLPSNVKNKSGKVSLDNDWGSNDIIVHAKINGEKRSVAILQKNKASYKLSTTYAYIFTSIFLLMSLYILGNIIARSNLRRKRFVNLLGLTLRMRIHLSILLVELISLTIIGTITILLLADNAKESAYNNASLAVNEIKHAIQEAELYNSFWLSSKDSIDLRSFNKLINPYLEKHNVGLNLYSLNGTKIYTTVSTNISNVIPNLINPSAFSKLKLKSNVSILQSEQVGNLDYYTVYANLRNKNGKLNGILEIPNYSSKLSIRANNSSIITMLINIYAFVFLLSSLFAFYITKRLTNSFSKIVTQFSKINLTETNQPLQWPYSDEIGLLIKEYNRTLVKLENSTALLAKSEREIAWREMARQIAHEIKNPLTPMSLSLQSLQAAIKRKDPNVPQLTEKMTKTVLEQIKVLTRTASNFSEFATMTDINARKESLLDVLESTTGIYSDSEDAEFLFVLPKKDIMINVDKVKLIRVLTNIIQNAIQSIPDDRMGQIILTVTKEADNYVDVSISDNGEGIPDEFRRKVFEPNFTTKSSGSGLGLAMCKDIMSKTGGNIYFESIVGTGSTFHLVIPIFQEEKN